MRYLILLPAALSFCRTPEAATPTPRRAAGDVIRVNFQPAGHPPPLRMGRETYLADVGLPFGDRGDRGNGRSYGWSSGNTGNARRRYVHPDCRYDGFVGLSGRTWEIALDDGDYRVNVLLGEPIGKYAKQTGVTVEGVALADPDGVDCFDLHENVAVKVGDGRLTVRDTAPEGQVPRGSDRTWRSNLCYIEIAPAAIGFPPVPAPPKAKPKQLAFPGAEGYAKYLTGGRLGDVYHVTNLDWTGPGSLQWGIASTYDDHPRTVVFDIGGTVGQEFPYPGIGANHSLQLRGRNITIAGQTSPGKGITIAHHPLIVRGSSNITMRYLRLRLGDKDKRKGVAPDVMTSEDNKGLFLDHVSMSWSIDGIWDSRRCGPMTVQWCIFAEPLQESLHQKGSHALLMSFRNINHSVTIHHNLFSTGNSRHPTLGSNIPGRESLDYISDFRNNVDYNWHGNVKPGAVKHNIVNNYFKPGRTSQNGPMMAVNYPECKGYVAGNVWDGQVRRFTGDNYAAAFYKYSKGTASRKTWEHKTEFDTGEFRPPTESAEAAYESVLAKAGCSLVRDTVDERLVRNVRERKGHVIDSQDQVGGWDPYPTRRRPAGFDTDRDGMPDAWERAGGLDPSDPEDRNGDADGDGYTNLEEYLDWLLIAPRQDPVAEPGSEPEPPPPPGVARTRLPEEKVAPPRPEVSPASLDVEAEPQPEPRAQRGRKGVVAFGVLELVAGLAIVGIVVAMLARGRRPGAGGRGDA